MGADFSTYLCNYPQSLVILKSRIIIRIPDGCSNSISEAWIDFVLAIHRRSHSEAVIVVDFDQVTWHVFNAAEISDGPIKSNYISLDRIVRTHLKSQLAPIINLLSMATAGLHRQNVRNLNGGHEPDAKGSQPVPLIVLHLIQNLTQRKVRVVCLVQHLGNKFKDDIKFIFP